MSDKSEWTRLDHVVMLLLCVGAAYGPVNCLSDYATRRGTNIESARHTQRCDVDGQQLGCVRDTAWWDGSRCSCALPGGRRIEYRLSREERGE